MTLRIPVSPGDLIDRITILEIKCERTTDPLRREEAQSHLHSLYTVLSKQFDEQLLAKVTPMREELRSINAILWDAEDRARQLRNQQDRLIEFAREAVRIL